MVDASGRAIGVDCVEAWAFRWFCGGGVGGLSSFAGW
jgi:hypothetical protein